MNKTIILWTKLLYYGQNYGTIPIKTRKLWFTIKKNYGNIPIKFKFLNKFIALELWFSMVKLCYYAEKYRKKYGTVEKLWYYTEKYVTLIYYGENRYYGKNNGNFC